MKRYYRGIDYHKTTVQPKTKTRKRHPKNVTCWVCYKEINPSDVVNIGGNRKMCIQHDNAYQLFPEKYVANMA